MLEKTDSLIILLVGSFKHSNIHKIFKKNFLNIIEAHSIKDAKVLLKSNPIDCILCDKKSIKKPYKIINHARKINENTACIISSHELKTQDLLMSIDLKIDAHLYEYDDHKKLLEQMGQVIETYLQKRNRFHFGKEFEDNNHCIMISKTDVKGFITYANDSFCNATGYKQQELLQHNHNLIRHQDNQKSLFKQLWKTISIDKSSWKGIIKNITKNGMPFYAQTIITPIIDINGNVCEYLGQRINISEYFCDKSKLVYNINNLDLSVLALIQIEEFDILEELYDKHLIQTIQKTFGEKILEFLPNNDIFGQIYYLGKGQYALHCDFYHFLKQCINLEDYLTTLIQKINRVTLDIDTFEDALQVVLSFAYGKESLYEDANYGLKQASKKQISIFDANDVFIKESCYKKENRNIIKTIKIALDNSNIISYFQPIVNNKTRTVEKYESLVRLIDEKNNILSPAHFLEAAKTSHYFTKITQNVLKNSFEMLCKVNEEVTINMCMSDIERKETMDLFFELLEHYNKHANRLVVELLEDENIHNPKQIKAFITGIKKQGVKVAIDDFGSGYSNFKRLLTFEPDIIKIDGSLIKNIEKDMLSRNMVETISFLSKKQNIKTVAEYVENENIYNILNEIGIDYSQGFFFGKPQKLACG